MKLRLLAFICALSFTTLACFALSGSGNDLEGQPGEVLFKDDFSDPESGWDRVIVADGVTDYSDGAYRIFVNTSNTDVWANPDLDFTDVRIDVETSKVGGDDDNDYGLICRYQDSENFYFFVISSDGYYGVGKVSAGLQQLIGMESMPPSESINQGNATNTLRADCVGSTLSFYVNNESLGVYEDTEFASGDVGLIAGTFDSSGVDIHFDNFMVSRP
jgi:hypothetical protein